MPISNPLNIHMKNLLLIALIACAISGCGEKIDEFSSGEFDWEARKIEMPALDSNKSIGSTYLAVYSEIYERNQHRTYKLTATISIRNISTDESLYLNGTKYYNTEGKHVHTYFDFPVELKPMETIEIIINQNDAHGGTGGNFVIDWVSPRSGFEPICESVMISASGQQGISFTSRGIRID